MGQTAVLAWIVAEPGQDKYSCALAHLVLPQCKVDALSAVMARKKTEWFSQ